MTNLAACLTDSARRSPDHLALRRDDETWTYAQLEGAVARFAGHLQATGVRAGDRVAVSLPNVPAFAIAYYGALRHGAVVVPMNPLLKPREVAYHLTDAGASLVVGAADDTRAGAAAADVAFLDAADLPDLLAAAAPGPLVPADDGSTAVLLYTSGTTGHPKGAELTHGNLTTNHHATTTTLLHSGADDVIMGCLPLFHVFGMTCALNTSVASGATLTLLPRFDPAAALRIVERDRVTVFEGVPTMYGAMLGAARDVDVDLSSLRTCISGGASMPVELMRAFEERFGCVILEGYGLSETSPVACFNHPDAVRKPGTIGTPIVGVSMRVVDKAGDDVAVGEVGELVISGPNVMRGYWNRPEATQEAVRDGWFHSGDLGRVDDDGYFSIVDRTKDLIIRAGFNVYPREVEEVLYEHPDVAEAAVVGVPHDVHGEEVVAYVVPHAGHEVSPDVIREFVKERVAPYKYPRAVHVIDALPKGPTGKILKRELPRTL